MVRWSEHPEYDEFLREVIPGHQESEIRTAFAERFGIVLTESQIGNRKHTLGIKSGTHGGRFKDGTAPNNKGKRWKDFMPTESQERCRATQFEKGAFPHNTAPLGAERVTKDGYIEVKVAMSPSGRKSHDNWVAKHRLVWERTHGQPVPDGCIVVFADGDKSNFDPDNLVLETRAQHCAITAHRIDYADAETHATACAIAELSLAIGKASKHERKCKMCGRAFRPRFSRQRTCDICLGRTTEREARHG